MAGEKNKKLHKVCYVSVPASRKSRSGGQIKAEDRVKASAEKTMRKALVEGRGNVQLGPNKQVYVGGLIPTVHPEHVSELFAGCGRILNIEFVCTRGTAVLQQTPLPAVSPEPIPGQLPTPRRTLRPRYIEENEKAAQKQSWLYAIVSFDDAAAATRALAKNGVTLYGLEDTQCVVRVVTSTSDLEETSAAYNAYALGRQGIFPSERGLVRKETELLSAGDLAPKQVTWGSKHAGDAASSSSKSSVETLKAKATANRVKWLKSESTVRPGQKAAFGGFMGAWMMGVKALCGISFKLTIV